MFDYNNTTVLFIWVLAFYFLPLAAGLIAAKKKAVSLTRISEIGRRLGDPLTVRVHNWSRKYKMACIKNGRWFLLFLLIFLNNLLLAAFVTRVIYGIVFLIPLFLTAWTGFGHGVILSNPRGRAGIILLFFEFGGYLFATVIGVKIGISVLTAFLTGEQFQLNIPLIYAWLTSVFLFIGAALESLSLKGVSKNVDLSNIDKMDFAERRQELARQFDVEDNN